MKRQSLFSKAAILFLLLSSSSFVFAQPAVLLKAGINRSTWLGDVGEVSSGRTGFNAGAQFQIPLGSHVWLVPEVEYSSKGAKIKDLDLSISLDYLIFPVVIRFAESSAPDVYYEIGASYGKLLNAKARIVSESGDVKELFNSTDFALVGGIGSQESQGVGFAIRYYFGLTNAWVDSDLPGGNSAWQFSLSYRLPKLKKK